MSPFTWHTENCSGLLIKGQPTSFRESRLDCVSTAGVQQVCGSGTEKQRHEDFFIHRQLSGMLSLLRAGDQSAASLFSAPFTVKINSTVHGGKGGCPLSAAARTASAADYVEQRLVLVSPSNSCGGYFEQEGRPFVLYGEWRLHPQVVWQRYGQADVDLFALQENAHCPLFFSLSNVSDRCSGSPMA